MERPKITDFIKETIANPSIELMYLKDYVKELEAYADKQDKAISVIHCCNELLSNSLADWANKNHWTYNFCDNKWWQLQESQNYIKLSTKELAKLCLKETT